MELTAFLSCRSPVSRDTGALWATDVQSNRIRIQVSSRVTCTGSAASTKYHCKQYHRLPFSSRRSGGGLCDRNGVSQLLSGRKEDTNGAGSCHF